MLPDDKETISHYGDPKFVLGGRWTPALAPIITTQPSALAVRAGQKATLSVAVAAVPVAAYQWHKDGAEIAGATGVTYEINSAGPAHAGTYAVVVGNSAGKVTSEPARLSVIGPRQDP
jgi:hypothetical protein